MEALVTRLVTALKSMGFKGNDEHRFLLGIVLMVEYLARQSPKNQARQSFVGMLLEALGNLVQLETVTNGVIIPVEGNEDTLIQHPTKPKLKAQGDRKGASGDLANKTRSSPCAKYDALVLDANISDHRGHTNAPYKLEDRDVLHIMPKDLNAVGWCFVASDVVSEDGFTLCKEVHLMPELGIGVVYRKNVDPNTGKRRASSILREFAIYPGDQMDRALKRVWESKIGPLTTQEEASTEQTIII